MLDVDHCMQDVESKDVVRWVKIIYQIP